MGRHRCQRRPQLIRRFPDRAQLVPARPLYARPSYLRLPSLSPPVPVSHCTALRADSSELRRGRHWLEVGSWLVAEPAAREQGYQ